MFALKTRHTGVTKYLLLEKLWVQAVKSRLVLPSSNHFKLLVSGKNSNSTILTVQQPKNSRLELLKWSISLKHYICFDRSFAGVIRLEASYVYYCKSN
jgi:hypothetical protein